VGVAAFGEWGDFGVQEEREAVLSGGVFCCQDVGGEHGDLLEQGHHHLDNDAGSFVVVRQGFAVSGENN
jgi:hypothetical protein